MVGQLTLDQKSGFESLSPSWKRRIRLMRLLSRIYLFAL